MASKNLEKANENLRYATLGFEEVSLHRQMYSKHILPGYLHNRENRCTD